MARARRCWGFFAATPAFAALSILLAGCAHLPTSGDWPVRASAQEQLPQPKPLTELSTEPPHSLPTPAPSPADKPLPINLPTALQLAGVQPIDIGLAAERIRVAAATLERAETLWLPTIFLGGDYFRHDGQLQDVVGNVFGTSKSTLMAGAGPSAVFAVSDAIFTPLAERQVVRAREAALQTARNDSLLAVAEAYFNVQQARGELAGALDAVRRAEEVAKQTEDLAGGPQGGIVPPVEVARTRTELARRRQLASLARERWRTASADLVRVLRLDPSVLVAPLEPPHLRVTLVGLEQSLDELIPMALTNRPELAGQQALVQATLERLRQERIRPLIPSVLLRGTSTNPAGTLAGGVFGGGRNDDLAHFDARSDFDIQLVWELQNLGFGNRARVNERRAENQLAVLELFRTQDRVAAEVAQAHAQLQSAASRLGDAEASLKFAVESVEKNLEGLRQTKRAADVVILVIRPQEAVAAVQALAQAYNDYYSAVADYDRAQFRLYRALGHPAQMLTGEEGACAAPPSGSVAPDASPQSKP